MSMSEAQIQRAIVELLESRNWLTQVMGANQFQSGYPDLYIFRRDCGERWLEIKRPENYFFTVPQRKRWRRWEQIGIGVWIMSGATEEEYRKLFKNPTGELTTSQSGLFLRKKTLTGCWQR